MLKELFDGNNIVLQNLIIALGVILAFTSPKTLLIYFGVIYAIRIYFLYSQNIYPLNFFIINAIALFLMIYLWSNQQPDNQGTLIYPAIIVFILFNEQIYNFANRLLY